LLPPYFVKEEKYALPPLGLLLGLLAKGKVRPEMAEVLAMTDMLRSELTNILSQQVRIVAALGRLADAAGAWAKLAQQAEEILLTGGKKAG
jgi:hypothetical protein